MTHADLIDRLNAGSGADARLCADVYSAVVPSAKPSPGLPGCVEICGDPTHMVNVSGLTSSLDACIGLMREVLPGWLVADMANADLEWHRDEINEAYKVSPLDAWHIVLAVDDNGAVQHAFGEHKDQCRAFLIAILQAVGDAG